MGLPTEEAFVFINGGTASKQWYLQIRDSNTGKRHRVSLGSSCRGIEKKQEATLEGGKRYFEYMGKIQRGEQIRSLSVGEMCNRFLDKEKSRISSIPHRGITQTRYRFLKNHTEKMCEFLGSGTYVDKITRERFFVYPEWRRDWARKNGKREVTASTIKQEMCSFKKILKEIAWVDKYIQSIPAFPQVKVRGKEATIRRDGFKEREWNLFTNRIRNQWAHLKPSTHNGSPAYETRLVRSKVDGEWVSRMAKARIPEKVITHRRMIYYCVMICSNTMARVGSIRKMQWKHVRKNTTLSKDQQKIHCLIDVPAENSKTAKGYTINAPVTDYLNQIRKLSKFTGNDDYVFCNQTNGKPFSTRVWDDYWDEMLVTAGFAEWRMRPVMESGSCEWRESVSEWEINGEVKVTTSDDEGKCCGVTQWSWTKDSKNLVWYSIRHTAITFKVLYAKNLTPFVLAAQANTSVKYIEQHYYHHEAERMTEELNAGRRYLRESGMEVDWMQ